MNFPLCWSTSLLCNSNVDGAQGMEQSANTNVYTAQMSSVGNEGPCETCRVLTRWGLGGTFPWERYSGVKAVTVEQVAWERWGRLVGWEGVMR